jgi:hypothetical protein
METQVTEPAKLVRNPAQVHAPKAKPDARPMRMALGAGGLAAMSALATAIVMPPGPVAEIQPISQAQAPSVDGQASSTVDGQASPAERPIRYVQLAPGQTAPPGARVVDASASAAGTVVVGIPAPGGQTTAQQPAPPAATPKPVPAPTPIIIKTTQSGKPVK